jgi:hypothetical protein
MDLTVKMTVLSDYLADDGRKILLLLCSDDPGYLILKRSYCFDLELLKGDIFFRHGRKRLCRFKNVDSKETEIFDRFDTCGSKYRITLIKKDAAL